MRNIAQLWIEFVITWVYSEEIKNFTYSVIQWDSKTQHDYTNYGLVCFRITSSLFNLYFKCQALSTHTSIIFSSDQRFKLPACHKTLSNLIRWLEVQITSMSHDTKVKHVTGYHVTDTCLMGLLITKPKSVSEDIVNLQNIDSPTFSRSNLSTPTHSRNASNSSVNSHSLALCE
jgi:hypothetical protein